MTSTRPYRKGLDAETAYKELKLFSGRQFDPQLVATFLRAHPTWSTYEEEITEEFLSGEYRKTA
jgi:HD-GYP domain-containing protein (c-di-GMP phosphodiesterase class II)